MTFQLRPIHAIYHLWIVLVLAVFAVFAWQSTKWGGAVLVTPVLVFELYQLARLNSREFVVDDGSVHQSLPPRGFGWERVDSFEWEEVEHLRTGMALQTFLTSMMWGASISVKLRDRYVTLHPEAFEEGALDRLLDIAERRNLLDQESA